MFPVLAGPLKERVLASIVPTYMADNTRARTLRSDGAYVHDVRARNQSNIRSQVAFMEEASAANETITKLPNNAGGGEKKQLSTSSRVGGASRSGVPQPQNRSRSRKRRS